MHSWLSNFQITQPSLQVIHAMQTNEVLNGIVALVEVGQETRALALRAALTALGATVVPSWNPLVTHLVWAEGNYINLLTCYHHVSFLEEVRI